MSLTLFIFVAAIIGLVIFDWQKRKQSELELERHSVSAQELHAFMGSDQKVLIFDVRQALDLLAYPEQIPDAQRVSPEDLLAKPNIIPMDRDVIIYCTCPSEKTSRNVLRRALGLGFTRVKFLRGGLAAWKAMGFPVEPYRGRLAFSSAATTSPRG